MDLNDITVAVRPRSHWEAVDLGCLMVRRWWKSLYVGWMAITLPIFGGLYIALNAHPLIAMLIVWWLKPVYERYPLLIVSHALFGTVPGARQASMEYLRLLPRQLIQCLTIRRLVPTRSFDQPVSQLENLAASERSHRLELMHRTAGSPAFWLTFICVHVEMFLTLGLIMLVYQLIPSEVDVNWWQLLVSADTGGLDWTWNLLYFVAIGLVGPIYAVAGFSLYINRRIELEGWDIELAFRRLMHRVGRGAATAAALLLCLGLALAVPTELRADEAHARSNSSKALIEEVMHGRQFNQERVTKVPKVLRSWFEPEKEQKQEQKPTPKWVAAMLELIAQSIEFLLWVTLISGIIWIVYRYRGWILQLLERAPPPFDSSRDQPTVMFGLDVSRGALPADPIPAAQALWAQRRYRNAVSLLYRVALVALMDRHQCRFRESDTEGQCTAMVERLAPHDTAERFRRLTSLWQSVAYAHRVPSDASFADACSRWAAELSENR